jgi:hypothetical protein
MYKSNNPEDIVNNSQEFLILEGSTAPTIGKDTRGIFEFNAHQIFTKNYVNPFMPVKRVHLKSGTGIGKTIAAILSAIEFINNGRPVLIITFLEQRFIDELTNRVEFGFITRDELHQMETLKGMLNESSDESVEIQLKMLRSTIKKRFSNNINIQGYKKFMHELFGTDASQKSTLNISLIEKYRNGLIIYDESQNAYNTEEQNTWGNAIQVITNVLGPNVHTLSISATPVTVSSELRDFLQLLTMTNGIDISKLQSSLTNRSAAEVESVINSIINFTHPEIKDYALPDIITSKTVTLADLSTIQPFLENFLKGKILFLPDTLLTSIPRRVTMGESIPGVRYLKFDRIKMSADQEFMARKFPTIYHLRDIGGFISDYEANIDKYAPDIPKGTNAVNNTNKADTISKIGDIERLTKKQDIAISSDAATATEVKIKADLTNGEDILEDNTIVVTDTFEGIEGGQIAEISGGYFRDTELTLLQHSRYEKYCKMNGIKIVKTEHGQYISGAVLRYESLGKFSPKYKRMFDIVIASEVGKVLIYHNEIHNSGVLTIQEIMRENGIIGMTELPNEYTLCTYCLKNNRDAIHSNYSAKEGKDKAAAASSSTSAATNYPFDITAPHRFVPARFTMIHSILSNSAARNNLELFNRVSNKWGEECKILIGSRKIREGVDFKAVMTQIILSMPNSILIYLQLIGRTVRNFSHNDMPPELRYVKLHTLVSSFAADSGISGELSVEEQDYMNKVQDYMIVQQYDKIMNRVAVDIHILDTAKRMSEKVRANNELNGVAEDIGPLTYDAPGRELVARDMIKNATYLALERYDEEVDTLRYLIGYSFTKSHIWKIEDMWNFIQKQPGTPNPANFNFKYFLNVLHTFPRTNLLSDYVLLGINDIEDFYKVGAKKLNTKFSHFYLNKATTLAVDIMEHVAGLNGGIARLSLLNCYKIYESYFFEIHLDLLRSTLSDASVGAEAKRRREYVLAFYANIFKLFTQKDLGFSTGVGKIIGYYYDGNIHYYNMNVWSTIPYLLEVIENNIVIGQYTNNMKFKIRDPINKQEKNIGDARKQIEGIVCQSKQKEDILYYINKLSIKIVGPPKIGNLCTILREELIRRESIKMNKVKWVYLY